MIRRILRSRWYILGWPFRWLRGGDFTAKATALVAIGTIILAGINLGMLVEMRHAGQQQHKDTVAALSKTDETIAALKDQAKLSSNQIHVMEEQQRPWLDAVPGADRPFVFDDKGSVEGEFSLTMVNVGNMPAVQVHVSAFLLPGTGPLPMTATEYQDRSCEMAETVATRAGERWMGDVLDVGDVSILAIGDTFSIFPNKSKPAKWGFSESNPKYVLRQQSPLPSMHILYADFMGCIAYRASYASALWHHRRFSFTVGKASANGGFAFADIDDQQIQPANMRFSEGIAYGHNRSD